MATYHAVYDHLEEESGPPSVYRASPSSSAGPSGGPALQHLESQASQPAVLLPLEEEGTPRTPACRIRPSRSPTGECKLVDLITPVPELLPVAPDSQKVEVFPGSLSPAESAQIGKTLNALDKQKGGQKLTHLRRSEDPIAERARSICLLYTSPSPRDS